MEEIEVKILDIDSRKVEAELNRLNAKKVFEGEVESNFYDYSRTLKQNEDQLRLRRLGDRTFLTFKHKISKEEVKIYEEKETEVSDFSVMKSIIESLGYELQKSLKKKRTSYVLNDVKFEIDKYTDEFSFIPAFMEIEARSKEEIFRHAKMLGFNRCDCSSKSTTEIIKDYSKK